MNEIGKAIQWHEESLIGAMVIGDTELVKVTKIAISALREKLEREKNEPPKEGQL